MLTNQCLFTIFAFAITALLDGVAYHADGLKQTVSYILTFLMLIVTLVSFFRIGIEVFAK